MGLDCSLMRASVQWAFNQNHCMTYCSSFGQIKQNGLLAMKYLRRTVSTATVEHADFLPVRVWKRDAMLIVTAGWWTPWNESKQSIRTDKETQIFEHKIIKKDRCSVTKSSLLIKHVRKSGHQRRRWNKFILHFHMMEIRTGFEKYELQETQLEQCLD